MKTELIGWIITTAVSVVLIIWQIRANRKLTKEIGGFKQDIPTIRFLNYNLYNDVVYTIIYGADISEKSKIYIEFPIEIGNIGEKTIEDVLLSISFPHDSTLPYDKDFTPNFTISGNSISRKYFNSSNEKLINYRILSIHPSVSNILAEYLTVTESKKKDLETFNLEFVNDFTKSLQNKVPPTCHDFVATLVAKNNKPIKVYFKTFLFSCKNLDELMKTVDYSNMVKIYGYPDNIFSVMLDLKPVDTNTSNRIKTGKIIRNQSGLMREN